MGRTSSLLSFALWRRVEWDVFARGSSHYTGPSVSLPGGRLRFSVAIYQSALLNSSTSNMADDTGNSIPPPSSRFNPRTVVEIGGTILGENPEGRKGGGTYYSISIDSWIILACVITNGYNHWEWSFLRGCTGLLTVNWVILFKFVKNCSSKTSERISFYRLRKSNWTWSWVVQRRRSLWILQSLRREILKGNWSE